MNLMQVFILAIVQGIMEFLPISSSGHLVFIPALMGMVQPSVFFDVLLHLGTLVAVVLFLWKDIAQILEGLFKRKKEYWLLVLKLIVAVIPAALVGILLKDSIEGLFTSPKMVGYAYFGTAILLFATLFIKDKGKTLFTLTWVDALIIGIFQAFALVPGFSRSGFTLVAALIVGMKKSDAFRFSFLIAIPAILGAFLLKLPDMTMESGIGLYMTGFMVAMVVGFFALYLLKLILKQSKLYWFGIYCFILALFLVIKFK